MPKYNWTRVQYPNGGYGYVKTDNNDQAIEYKRDGTFKVYSQPNEKSHSFYTSFETKPRTIQRVPDDHEAHLAQQRQVDEKVRQVTPSAGQLFNVATVGGLNNLSPTQWMRRAYDTGQLIQGHMPLNEYMNKLYYGNNGIVSDEYARKHPYRTMAANLAGDIATFGAASTLRRMPNWYRTMQAENQAVQNTVANNWRNVGRGAQTINHEWPNKLIKRKKYNFNFDTAKPDLYDIYPKINTPFAYDEFGEFIPNKNYYYRTGWGIIDDAVETGKIRVPKGDYKTEALKKYPWLDNGNPFSTTLLNHKFPYFSEGNLWNNQAAKLGKTPQDLIAIPNDVPGVKWVAGSKYGSLLKNKKPSEVGGRATPLINGETNSFPTSKASLFKYNDATERYEPIYPNIKDTPIYTERPSSLTEAERLGIPKSERNNIHISEQFIHPAEAVRTGRQYVRPSVQKGMVSEPLMDSKSDLRAAITPEDLTNRKFFSVEEYGPEPIYTRETVPDKIRIREGDITESHMNDGTPGSEVNDANKVANEWFNKADHGQGVSYETDYSLSTDSYPIALLKMNRWQQQGLGQFIKSESAPQWMRLNKLGNKSFEELQEAISRVNKLTGQNYKIEQRLSPIIGTNNRPILHPITKQPLMANGIYVQPVGFFKYKKATKFVPNL